MTNKMKFTITGYCDFFEFSGRPFCHMKQKNITENECHECLSGFWGTLWAASSGMIEQTNIKVDFPWKKGFKEGILLPEGEDHD